MPASDRQTSHRPGTAIKNKGQVRLASILEAGKSVLIEAGYARFTMRKVAARAGIGVGNLSYYYGSKEDLLRDLVDYVINGYLAIFDRLRNAAGQSPEKQLESILDYWIEDLGAPETTGFFPELWALANHDPHVARLVDRLYARAREPLVELTGLINPSCTLTERQQLALYMCATMEGLTIFAGNNKPWGIRRQQLKRMAIDNFMQLAGNCGHAAGRAAGGRAT